VAGTLRNARKILDIDYSMLQSSTTDGEVKNALGGSSNMSAIRIRGLLQINPRQLEAFQAIAEQLVIVTKQKDPGTLGYDYFIDHELEKALVLEHYDSIDSFLAHLSNIKPVAVKFAATFKVELLEVCGDVTPQLAAMMKEITGEANLEHPKRCRFYRLLTGLSA
jgi:quinol monooxygenase YgiN